MKLSSLNTTATELKSILWDDAFTASDFDALTEVLGIDDLENAGAAGRARHPVIRRCARSYETPTGQALRR